MKKQFQIIVLLIMVLSATAQTPCDTINFNITQNDTTICFGDSVVLSVGNTNIYSACALPTNLQNGLVAYYPFCGNANDESGNSNNGIVSGAILSTDRFGNTNSAYSFNGINCCGIADPVQEIIITDTLLDLSKDFTISCWMKSTDINKYQQCLFNSINHTGFAVELNNEHVPTKLMYAVGPSNAYWDLLYAQGIYNTYQNNTWYHVLFTKNSTNYTIYMNTTFDGSSVVPNSINYTESVGLRIGSIGSGHEIFKGSLDDVGVWSRALSSQEIQDIYNYSPAVQTNPTYIWSTGDTTSTISVSPSQTTTYWVQQTQNGVSCIDSVTITVNSDTSYTNITACDSLVWNGVTYDSSGVYSYNGNGGNNNYSMSFDGANDDITGIASSSLNAANTNNLTISAWVKPNNFNGSHRIFNHSSGNGSSQQYSLNVDAGKIYFLSGAGNFEQNGGNISSVLLTLGVWNHISMTYDGSAVRLYLDGDMVFENFVLDNFPTNWMGYFYIGRRADGAERFNGKIDDVNIWEIALDSTQIQQYMNCPPTGNEAGLVGYWNFEEGPGSTVTLDQTTNGNDGTINGAIYSANVPSQSCGLTNANGCDSTAVLNLTIHQGDTSYTNITACDSYSWNDSTYTQSGTYSANVGSNNNYSMSFDGNDKVDLNTTLNNLGLSQSNISIMLNVNPAVFGGNNSEDILIGSSMTGGNSDNGIKIQTSTGDNFSATIGGPDNNDTYHIWGTPKTTNQWYNVAIVADRYNNTFTLYVNGIQEDQVIISNLVSAIGDGHSLELGYYVNSNYYFNGLLDNVHIWNTALNPQEIQQYMNCPPTGNESGLVGYWNFEEGSGTTAIDLTSNGNNGTINGATYDTNVPSQSCNLTNVNGCDSTAILNLTIDNSVTITNTVSICSGDSFTVGTSTYNTDGTYTDVLTTIDGCDSTVTTILTIDPIGCTDASAFNYDSNAICDDGSCIATVNGCTDPTACNYDAAANTDDGSCVYPSTSTTTVTACDSYAWNGQTYTSSSQYTWLGVNSNGCDSTAVLNLTINQSDTSYTNITACDSLVWNGTTYTQSGIYSYSGASSPLVGTFYEGGYVFYIDSLTGLGLIATDNYIGTAEWGCYGTAVNGADGQVIGSGYQNTLDIVNSGCSSTNGSPTAASIAYNYNNGYSDWYLPSLDELSLVYQNLQSSGVLNYNTGDPNNWYWSSTECQSNQAGNAGDLLFTNGNIAYCNNKNSWQGGVIAIRSFQIPILNTINGCDSTATLNLTINGSTTSSVSVTECDSYDWNGTTYTSSGVYTFSSTNSNACDSTAILNLTINNPTSSYLSVVECEDYTWSVNNVTYSTSGLYIDSSLNADGCTQVDSLDLIIYNATTSIDVQSACDSYAWIDGNTYSNSNNSATYTILGGNLNGCDSIITLNLTINHTDTSYTNITACDSLVWNGTTYDSSGTYSFSGNSITNNYSMSFDGVDDYLFLPQNGVSIMNNISSTVSFWFKMPNPVQHPYDMVFLTNHWQALNTENILVVGLWGSATPSNEGKIYGHLRDSNNGVNTHITSSMRIDDGGWHHYAIVLDKNQSLALQYIDGVLDQTYSLPSNFNFDKGQGWKCSGDYGYANYFIENYTDEIQFSNYNLSQSEIQQYMNCPPTGNESGLVGYWNFEEGSGNTAYDQTPNGNNGTINGAIYDTNVPSQSCNLTNANGCDSTAVLNLTINQADTSYTTITACDSVVWNGTTYNSTGIYTWNGINSLGCDSTATLNLTINPSTASTSSATACDDYSWNGTVYTSSGAYTYVTTNTNGCDSTATLNLTINPSTTSTSNVTACDSVVWNGTTYSSSGMYNYSTTNLNGCDSTVTLNLTINYSNTGTTSVTACNTYLWNTQSITTSGSYNQTFTNVAGCDSTHTLVATINYSNTGTTSVTACDTYLWNTQTITVSGSYNQTFTNVDGCDSTHTLIATINYSNTGTTSVTACDTYLWNSQTITSSGNYDQTFTNVAGCDSVHTLIATINYSNTGTTSVTACDTYLWNAQTITSSGNYNQTFTNVDGCDSTHTLVATIIFTTIIYDTVSICKGESYVVSNSTYNNTGDYTDTILNSNGCLSIIYTNLTVGSSLNSSINQVGSVLESTVNGGFMPYSYLWNTLATTEDINITSSGLYWLVVTDSLSCPVDTAYYNGELHTSISEIGISDLKVYPNPSRDIFNIVFSSNTIQNLDVRVINVVGEVIVSEELDQFLGEYSKQINLEKNAKGIYFLEIETNDGIINKKLILQ